MRVLFIYLFLGDFGVLLRLGSDAVEFGLERKKRVPAFSSSPAAAARD